MISFPLQEFLLSKKVLEEKVEKVVKSQRPLKFGENPEEIAQLERDLINRGYTVIRSEEMTCGMPNRIIIGRPLKYISYQSNTEKDFLMAAERRGNLPYIPGEIFRGSIPEAEDVVVNQTTRHDLD
ncbi:hypothetical protein CMI45_02395 [Candidatus Pacearchaeota archaeon]|nr:hypothetical protein [Candidatus Pacearchaeota archaeon]|tara:strand:+ start:549 stop:926 length:378 start_codon:yes stop_codon:yes gene_type:complete